MTPKQAKILSFIKVFIRESGFSPSYSEIANSLGFKSKGQLVEAIKVLEKDGYITFRKNEARSIKIVQNLNADLHRVVRQVEDGELSPKEGIEHVRTILIAQEAFA